MRGNYLYTTPELRARRQEAIKAYVANQVREDRAAEVAVGAAATAAVGTAAAGIIAASTYHGPAEAPPNVPAPDVDVQPRVEVPIAAPTDAAGAIADEAINDTVLHRQDGKKKDYRTEATQAYRFQEGLGRSRSEQLATPTRIDTFVRGSEHKEYRDVTGRGSGTYGFFGRFFSAPEIPTSMKNFEPVK